MNNRYLQRLALLTCGLLLVLWAVPCVVGGFLWREWRQERLSQALVAAIKRNETKQALSALEQGANANANDTPIPVLPFWPWLHNRWTHNVQQSSTAAPSALVLLINGTQPHGEWESGPPENAGLAEALLRHGANANDVDASVKECVLRLAVMQGKFRTVRLLLRYGANPNAGLETRWTVLMDAAANGYADCEEALLAAGANVNARTEDRSTALMYAADYGRVDCVRVLLAYHADPNLQTDTGTTALAYAQGFAANENKWAITAHLLQAAGAKE